MNDIELLICLILLFMAVPDWCHRLRRPALLFPFFILFGFLLGPLISNGAGVMLKQAGQYGFLLLLFEVGLEIDLPRFREFQPALRFALGWSLVQYPLVLALASFNQLTVLQGLVSAAALTACSVGMTHSAWQAYQGLPHDRRDFVLLAMVALELLSIAVLAVETPALGKGVNWLIPLKLAGITFTVILIAHFAESLSAIFQLIIEKTTHWRVYWLVLLILAVCAVGERLGLSGAKTAFVLGLCLSRARHDGLNLEEFIAPISRRFLIPLFFVALGTQVSWGLLFSTIGLTAFGTAMVLLGAREILHRRWWKTGGDANTYLLFCPNLTIVALAANLLL